jgi:hypothetical protein
MPGISGIDVCDWKFVDVYEVPMDLWHYTVTIIPRPL